MASMIYGQYGCTYPSTLIRAHDHVNNKLSSNILRTNFIILNKVLLSCIYDSMTDSRIPRSSTLCWQCMKDMNVRTVLVRETSIVTVYVTCRVDVTVYVSCRVDARFVLFNTISQNKKKNVDCSNSYMEKNPDLQSITNKYKSAMWHSDIEFT